MLDIYCGPGMAIIELARLGHRVLVIDSYKLFIEMLLARAKKERFIDRITALLGNMLCVVTF
jgi:2-polyprenyl-3-methyl-5-hydroxy-6-metoxy-1,4-benzoquinol methylase